MGRWRVVEPVGVGGQGAVYRVEDLERPGVFGALKLSLHAHDGRAEREVALMRGRAAHPHVVGFLDTVHWPGVSGDARGFIMEWVPGQSLDVWAETEGTSFRRLVAVAATVARTLGELHARGVLHRDLKPEHIRVRASDGQPVLLDFGAGWYPGAAPLTTGPLPPATLYLLGPEAVRFLWHAPSHPGARYAFQPTDDLYALGVCLYRATTGHYPFSEWLPADVLQSAIVHVRPRAPVLVNPRVPRALSEVIVRLLAKDPRARYPSGEALHAALVAADRDGDRAWDAGIFEFEEVASGRAGEPPERHLLRPPQPRPSWTTEPPPAGRAHWPRSFMRTVAAALLLLLVTHLAPDVSEPPVPDTFWSTDAGMGSGLVLSERGPPPAKNQKRAPCKPGLEVEVSGACWHSVNKQRPPNCPAETVAHRDECLWPVPDPRPLPTSVEEGAPEAR